MPGHASSFAELEAHEQRRARATRWLLAALGLCAGQLMLWPGYLRHCSRVHLSRAPWVRVALRIDLPDAGRAGRG